MAKMDKALQPRTESIPSCPMLVNMEWKLLFFSVLNIYLSDSEIHVEYNKWEHKM